MLHPAVSQDSLALARFYRQTDLFITVTCNPTGWKLLANFSQGKRQPTDQIFVQGFSDEESHY